MSTPTRPSFEQVRARATAGLVEGHDMAEIPRTIAGKYAMMTKMTKLFATLGVIVAIEE